MKSSHKKSQNPLIAKIEAMKAHSKATGNIKIPEERRFYFKFIRPMKDSDTPSSLSSGVLFKFVDMDLSFGKGLFIFIIPKYCHYFHHSFG